MEEFIKASPSIKEIVLLLQKLKPYEEIRIVGDKDGNFDTYIFEQTTKKMIKSGQVIAIKDVYKR